MKLKDGKIVSAVVALFVILVVGICFLFKPLFGGLKFGLDLQGGFEILYKAESVDGSKMTHDKLVATYKTLSKRIDSLGVSEPEITIEGNDKIRVKLAGVKDPEEARTQLSTVATLSFRDVNDNLLMGSDVLVSGGAKVGQDGRGGPAVSLSVKDKDEFFRVTNEISKKSSGNNLIVIWLDFKEGEDSYSSEANMCGTDSSNCLSAASVSQGFASDVIIQGSFTEDEVTNLVDLINSGSLPANLKEISSNTVGASFGNRTLSNTFKAGVIGISLIILVMICFYHFGGFISSVAMIIYTFLVFLLFWLLGGVLTLPGIAALILGIGMAIDSNVIMFARIREELLQGRSVKVAVKNGSKSSLSAIIDANITTFIVALIMFNFGESSIKGFATMLMITVVVTMLTMVFLTRAMLKLFTKDGFFDKHPQLFINIKKEDIPDVSKNEKVKKVPFGKVNFLKHKYSLVLLSLFIITAGSVTFAMKGLPLGIDYKAGTSVTIVTDKKVTEKQIREDFKENKLEVSTINVGNEETSVRIDSALDGETVKKVNKYFEEKYDAKVNIGVISNVVAKELVKNAILAVLLSMLGIILYISIRFNLSYALGGVVALFHDVAIMLAFFVMTRFEINSMFIAAVLAIIGYSINDTIVIFDRFREEIKKTKEKITKDNFESICNKAIQATFTRTLLTSITTLVPIVALLVIGSKEILTFNVAMLVGLVSGTYSSIFIAGLIFITIEKRKIGKPKKKKIVYTDDFEEKKIKGINC